VDIAKPPCLALWALDNWRSPGLQHSPAEIRPASATPPTDNPTSQCGGRRRRFFNVIGKALSQPHGDRTFKDHGFNRLSSRGPRQGRSGQCAPKNIPRARAITILDSSLFKSFPPSDRKRRSAAPRRSFLQCPFQPHPNFPASIRPLDRHGGPKG